MKIDETDPLAWADAMRRSSLYWAKKLAPDWSILLVINLNIIRDKIIDWLQWWFCAPGVALGHFAGSFLTHNLMIETELNAAISDAMGAVKTKVDEALEGSRENIQAGLDSFRSFIQTAVNQGLGAVIPILYQMIGLAPGQLISPLNTRNVGTDGFEFYSLSANMSVHYVAVGPRAF